jgi:hypothetical protein
MAFHVIDAHKWKLPRPSRRFAEREPNQQRTNQTRSLSGGYPVEIVGMNPRFAERPVGERSDGFDVGASGHLWYDATKPGVQIDL